MYLSENRLKFSTIFVNFLIKNAFKTFERYLMVKLAFFILPLVFIRRPFFSVIFLKNNTFNDFKLFGKYLNWRFIAVRPVIAHRNGSSHTIKSLFKH